MTDSYADRAGYDLEIEKIVIKASRVFKRQHDIDLRHDALASVRLREMVIRMVKDNERKLFIPFITATSTGPKHMEISFSGSEIRQARKHLKANA